MNIFYTKYSELEFAIKSLMLKNTRQNFHKLKIRDYKEIKLSC